MFWGHFALAPRTLLWLLVLAAQFAALLRPIFLLLAWELMRIAQGNTRVTPLEFLCDPWSHSLVAQ